MKLPKLEDLQVGDKRILLRADLDININLKSQISKLSRRTRSRFAGKNIDLRLKALIPTLKYLMAKGARIVLIGHRGRPARLGGPKGKIDKRFSLEPLAKELQFILQKEVKLSQKMEAAGPGAGEVLVFENLRFDSGEEKNDEAFAKKLFSLGDFYVNEAFAASHRKHASIVALPLMFKSRSEKSLAAGPHFMAEVENLSRVFSKPKRPVVLILGGFKGDKLSYSREFQKIADKILLAGRLPDYLEGVDGEKTIKASLLPDKEDLTTRSIEEFEKEIGKARTIVVSGPMGKFEDKEHRKGTERILGAVASSSAYKIAGGGDTEKAIAMFGLENKFDWISVGGGAMLEFLAKGTLPGIEALRA